MVVEVSNEYRSTFNRRIETLFYNELRRDYAFPERYPYMFCLFANKRAENKFLVCRTIRQIKADSIIIRNSAREQRADG